MKVRRLLPCSVTEIIRYFRDHDTHSTMYQPRYLAWNVKVGDFWLKEKHYKEYGLDHALDEEWEQYEKDSDGLFWECCNDGLYWIFEGEWTTYPGDEHKYLMYQEGRSGGWLVLHEYDGEKLENFDIDEIISEAWNDGEYEFEMEHRAPETDDLHYEEIAEEDGMHFASECYKLDIEEWKNGRQRESYAVRNVIDMVMNYAELYYFCKSLDGFDATEEYLHQLAHRRSQWEEEKKEEAA